MSIINNPITKILSKQPVILLDGAMATELEAKGCNLDDPLWSATVLLENPDLIYQVHLDYFRAGADIAITASYQATVEGLTARGLTEVEALSLIRKTVDLAKKARDDFWKNNNDESRVKPLIAASVGPYGAFLSDGSEYVGEYGVQDEVLTAFHQPRLAALIEAGADVIAFETIPSLQEAKILSTLLQEYKDTYAWMTFTLRNEKEISDGTPLKVCAEELESNKQIVSIGINCAPITLVTEAIKQLYTHTTKEIIVYPNSGEIYNPETKTWHGDGQCDAFSSLSEAWVEAGASIIGGCCRTTPGHIEELSKRWRTSVSA